MAVNQIDREPLPGLRVLIPDGKHICGDVLRLLVYKGLIDPKTKDNLIGDPNNNLHVEVKRAGLPFFSLNLIKNRRISRQVARGAFDLGFTTTDRLGDYLAEASFSRKPIPTNVEPLIHYPDWFDPRLRLSLLVRDNEEDNGRFKVVRDLSGEDVVSTYVGQTTKFFREHKTAVRLDTQIDGKEEGLVKAGTYAATVVIVKNGDAMRAAALREMAVIMGGQGEIQPVLVYNPRSLEDRDRQLLLDQFLYELPSNKPLEAKRNSRYRLANPVRWASDRIAVIYSAAAAACSSGK